MTHKKDTMRSLLNWIVLLKFLHLHPANIGQNIAHHSSSVPVLWLQLFVLESCGSQLRRCWIKSAVCVCVLRPCVCHKADNPEGEGGEIFASEVESRPASGGWVCLCVCLICAKAESDSPSKDKLWFFCPMTTGSVVDSSQDIQHCFLFKVEII